MTNFGIKIAFIGFVASTALSATSIAASVADGDAVLSPVALFNRCYTTITRQYLPPNHRLYAAVKSGALAPVDACMQVLTGSAFDQMPADPAEKAAVIQTFSDFHRTWFPAVDYETILSEDYFSTLWMVRDPTEPSLYVTRALFGTNVPFSSLLTESSGMVGQRAAAVPDPSLTYPTNYGYLGLTQGYGLTPPFTYAGALTGVQRMSENTAYTGVQVLGTSAFPTPFGFYQHLGGGILGSQSFLLLNYGRAFEPNDGGTKVPRRWSKAVFSDLLCRELPVLRLSDAAPFADSNAALPFRKFGSCLSCHETADNMANAARNIMTISLWQNGVSGTAAMAAFPVDGSTYEKQSPDGRLYYRSFDGTLIDKNVNGLAQLGDALSQQDDVYVCGAARYFEFFTGLHVNLQDSGDPASPQLSPGDQLYRDQVIDLGRKFHQHQSITTLIHDIISSPFYQQASMRKAGTVN